MKRRPLAESVSDRYIVGVNYWASHAAHKMWERWDAEQVEQDMALVRSLGLNAVRTFFWTPQLNPLPGVIDQNVLIHFQEFLDICQRHRLSVFPTIFVGHMSGINWDIPWRQGRDFCADPYMVYWESYLVKELVARFKDHPAILGWILTNELPNYTGSLRPETATTWTRAMYYAAREADPNVIVGTGDGARCEARPDYDGFRVEWIRDHVSYFGVHLYNYFHWEQGDFDELRTAYRIPCRIRYVDVGKPVLLEEFGLSDLNSGSEEAVGYYRSVLYGSWANGACGALAWCLTDFDLMDMTPYEFQPHELKFGVATATRKPKPQGEELAAFARFARQHRIERFQMAPPQEAILVPYYMYEEVPRQGVDRLRIYRVLEETFVLCKMAGLNPDFVRSFDDLTQYRLVMLPGGFRLKSPQWVELQKWVETGGTLYVSYVGLTGGIYAPNFDDLFGCRQRVCYGSLAQSEDDKVDLHFKTRFGAIPSGETLVINRNRVGRESAYLPLTVQDAEVVAVDSHGRPAIVRRVLGKGKVILSSYPLEYMVLNTPDGSLNTELYRIYEALQVEAGISRRFKGGHPYLEVEVLKGPGTPTELLLVMNQTRFPVETVLHDNEQKQAIELSMGSNAVKVFASNGSRWELVFEREALPEAEQDALSPEAAAHGKGLAGA